MYTDRGIDVVPVTPGRRERRLIPWDSSKRVRYKDGGTAVRHVLLLRPEHFPVYVMGNGVGGFRRADAGRTLVVDRQPDGRWIDWLVSPPVKEAAGGQG